MIIKTKKEYYEMVNETRDAISLSRCIPVNGRPVSEVSKKKPKKKISVVVGFLLKQPLKIIHNLFLLKDEKTK